MITIPLLSTKLFLPPHNIQHVPRLRLHELLTQGLHNRLTLISAPAGFGKTTLVSDWLHHTRVDSNDQVRFAWLSLDEGDNDLVRFLTYLSAAFQELLPTSSDFNLPDENVSTEIPTVERFLNDLINRLAAAGDHSLGFIMDDYHLIESLNVHYALNYLIDHLPPNLHLILMTRSDPPLHLARLRGRGDLVEIRQNDLRFNPDEAATFFEQSRKLMLSNDQVKLLTTRTEGWIAGLQMAALALQSEHEAADPQSFDAFFKDFSGNSRFVLDYLMEEVLSNQPAEIQSFLLHTSILNRMCGPLCDSLLKDIPLQKTSQQILQELEHANLFIISLDSQRQWYRYHHLFGELLRQRLETACPGESAVLHRQASGWFESNGFLPDAIDHALAALQPGDNTSDDVTRTINMIEVAAEPALSRGEVVTFAHWVDALPNEPVRRRPYLCLYHALSMLLVSGGSRERIEARLEDARAVESDIALQNAVAIINSFIAGFRGNVYEYQPVPDEVLNLLAEKKRFLYSLVVALQSITDVYFTDLKLSSHRMEEASKLCRESGNWMAYALVRAQIGDLFTLQGKLLAANAEYEQIISTIGNDSSHPFPAAGMAYIGKGNILREWNDLEAASLCLKNGMLLLQKWGEYNAMDYYTIMARLLQSRGQGVAALEQLHRASLLAQQFDLTFFDDLFVDCIQAELWIKQGNLPAAQRWARDYNFDRPVGDLLVLQKPENHSLIEIYLYEIQLTTLARLRLAEGQAEPVIQICTELLRTFEKQDLGRYTLECLILLCRVYALKGDINTARQMLEKALAQAEPQGYIRIFLDEGPALANIINNLRSLIKDERLNNFAGRLLDGFVSPESCVFLPEGLSGSQPEMMPAVTAAAEILSEREREVLKLLAAGLSNQQIAVKMVIALSTVKTHVHSIYQKLGITNRALAVTRARELNLL
ncbi:MAG: LuxR C-terminal-related transcriptional regulator [Anaerolineae bacterium]|nr:LuxR C-terminal-related transcriptional regulator [Anaerolineae bacterium]